MPLAIRLLLLSARYAEAFRADPITTEEVSAGARFRRSLGEWATFIRNHESQPFSAVPYKVLSSFVVAQHLGIASARSGDEKSRMRLCHDDKGLSSALTNAKKVLVPKRTADRLVSALSLMSECGLTHKMTTGNAQEVTFSAV